MSRPTSNFLWLLLVAGCAPPTEPSSAPQAITSCETDVWIPNPVLNDCHTSEVLPCARSDAPLVALPDDTALYVGGFAGGDLTKATDEVDRFRLGACGEPASFEPETRMPEPLAATAAAWIPFKKNHANTGRLLVAGGIDTRLPFDEGLRHRAYLYDPSTKTWTEAASLPYGRLIAGAKHQTAVLRDGSVLFYGGKAADSPPAWINPAGLTGVYDTRHTHRYFPNKDRWATTDMAEGRHYCDHVLLADGRLVVAGGRAVIPSAVDFALVNSIEVYDPEGGGGDGSWRLAARLPTVAGEDAPPFAAGVLPDPDGGRMVHSMARTPDDKVLIVGGNYREPPWTCRSAATLTFVDPCPASGVCALDGARCRPCPGAATCNAATGLCGDAAQTRCFPRGRPFTRRSVLLYDPVSDTIALATPMPEPRMNHLMQDLGGGEYLVAGGQLQGGAAAAQSPTTWIFHYTGDPSQGYGWWRAGPPLPSFMTASGPSPFIRGQAELEYGRLAGGTLWIGNGFDATLPGTSRPNGRSYVLLPSNPLPLTFR